MCARAHQIVFNNTDGCMHEYLSLMRFTVFLMVVCIFTALDYGQLYCVISTAIAKNKCHW